jgi:hypothetical protein
VSFLICFKRRAKFFFERSRQNSELAKSWPRAGWREVKHPETPPTIESMSDEQLEAILIEQVALQSAPPMKLIQGKKQKD